MASLQSRLADRLVLLLGVRRRLQELAEAVDDPDRFQKLLARTRRTDRVDPPRRFKRAWRHERADVGGFPLHILTGKAGDASRVILYLHGGGYMFGPFGTEWAALARLARNAAGDFAMLVYPKAPEHDARLTVEVAKQACDQLTDRYGASAVTLIGTSAGGALALALLSSLRKLRKPQPRHVVLLSPGVDMTLREDVSHLEATDVLLTPDHVRSAGALYAGPLGPEHPWVSPTFGDLSLLPPLRVFAGTREILFPSIETFVDRARAASTEVVLHVGEDQQHTWPIAPIPEGRAALRDIGELLARS